MYILSFSVYIYIYYMYGIYVWYMYIICIVYIYMVYIYIYSQIPKDQIWYTGEICYEKLWSCEKSLILKRILPSQASKLSAGNLGGCCRPPDEIKGVKFVVVSNLNWL